MCVVCAVVYRSVWCVVCSLWRLFVVSVSFVSGPVAELEAHMRLLCCCHVFFQRAVL